MLKSYSLNTRIAMFLFLVACYVFFVAYFRFTHQDVGWYHAYADRIANKFSLNDSQITWSFSEVNGNNSAGVFFILAQFLAIVISSNDLLAIKILTGIIAFSTFYSFFYLLRRRLQVKHYVLFSLIFVFDPLFTYQIMNRPEMLATCIGLIIFNVGLKKDPNPWNFFLISLLTAILLDVHPTAVYMVVGFNVILFFRNYQKILYFLGGGLLGIGMVAGLNYYFNNNIGILSIFGKDSNLYMGDHYFPLFYDPLTIIITRPIDKLKYYAVFFLFGALLYYLVAHYKQLRAIIHNNSIYKTLIINAIVFFLLSNLFSEGGNGYHLYSLAVYLPLFIVLYSEILALSTGMARRLFILFLLIVPAFGFYKSLPRIYQWVKNNQYFNAHYYDIRDHVKDGDKLLVRPTFSFALNSKKVICEPTFPILIYMHNHKTSFVNTILIKDFDIVAIDEMFLHDADKKTLVDKFSNGPFHKAIEEVKFDTGIIKVLADKGIFVPLMEYKDFYHGQTVFYRVDKLLLKEYCEGIEK